jgi:hypothetical protein
MKVSDIKRKIISLESDKLYSIDDIMKMGLIVDGSLQPARWRVYRLIRSKELEGVNMGKGYNSRWFVKGKHLRAYVSKLLRLPI